MLPNMQYRSGLRSIGEIKVVISSFTVELSKKNYLTGL